MNADQTLNKAIDLSAAVLGENVQALLAHGVPLVNIFDNLASEASVGNVADIASANSYLFTWLRDRSPANA